MIILKNKKSKLKKSYRVMPVKSTIVNIFYYFKATYLNHNLQKLYMPLAFITNYFNVSKQGLVLDYFLLRQC